MLEQSIPALMTLQGVRVKDFPEISKLSTPEKILLVEDLWDSTSSDESSAIVPESHKAALDERFERYRSAPGALLFLDDHREDRMDRMGSGLTY